MRNKENKIQFRDMTSGSYAFLWSVSEGGYRLFDKGKLQVVPDAVPEWGEYTEADTTPPWLVPWGREQWQATPLENKVLHRKFASLPPSEDAIITFANKHGMLGKDVILEPHGGGIATIGESIHRWRKEMGEIGSLLALWDLVQDRDAGKLGQLIIWPNDERVQLKMGRQYDDTKRQWKIYPLKEPKGHLFTFAIIASQRSIFDRLVLQRWQRGDVVEPAKYYVCQQVNKRLEGHVHPQVLPFVQDEVYLFPKTLLVAMWLMFMWEITGKVRVIHCPSCGFWAEQMDRRQRYCSNACRQRMYRQRNAVP